MATERAAEIAERNAFDQLQKLLPVSKVIAAPAGSGTDFPDFGYRIIIDNKKVDLHFEFKDDWKTQMGSMRDWIFDGQSKSFSTPTTDPNKEMLISVINNTPEAKLNASRLLKDIKTFYSPKVTKLYSGALTVLPSSERKKQYLNMVSNMSNFTIANIQNSSLGQKVLDHYHKKFVANLQLDADYSVLFFMIGDTIWYVEDNGTATDKIKKTIASYFNTTSITTLSNLTANLEVRIQPRPSLKSLLETPNKPVKGIDVMANFRLKTKPAGGVKVI